MKFLHREAEEEAKEENVTNNQLVNNNQCPSPVHIDPISGIYIGDIVEEREAKEAKLNHVTRKLVGIACIQPKQQQQAPFFNLAIKLSTNLWALRNKTFHHEQCILYLR